MSELIPIPSRKRSSVCSNELLIDINTQSGYRMSRFDDKGKEYVFLPDIDNETLAASLLDSLAHSRFVLPTEDPDLYNYKQAEERWVAFVTRLLAFTGCKTKTKLFKKMKNCDVEELDGFITFKPSRQVKWNAWDGEGITPDDYVVIPSNSSPEEIGKTVRLALSRCL